MKRNRYTILNEHYTSKKALLDRIRGIRDTYKDNEPLWPYDLEFMTEVLTGHPDHDQKVGSGIRGMTVRPDPVWKNTRCFILLRTDGTETDFSFMECLTATTHAQKFNRALRTAIESDIIAFKQEFFDNNPGGVVCPYSGEPLLFAGAHVDHKKPLTFKNLVTNFVGRNKIDIDKVVILGDGEDNVYQNTLADKELEARWIEYHRRTARLQVVSKKANLELLR